MILDGVSDTLYTEHAKLFPMVGKLGTGAGTLIAPNWVLTAAHVPNGNFTLGGVTYAAEQVYRHPQFLLNGSNLNYGFDIALVRLSTPVVGIAPAKIYTGSFELGAVISMAGYGATGVGSTGSPANPGTFRAGTNIVDLIQSTANGPAGQIGAQNALLVTDFDALESFDPSGQTNSLGSETPTDLEYHLATFDSGGGAFLQENGEWYLAGVHSGVASQQHVTGSGSTLLFGYGAASYMTRVSSYQSFIAEISGVPEPSSVFLVASCLALGSAFVRGFRGRN
jgi:hypothetical protein